jgi:hypothetical protein
MAQSLGTLAWRYEQRAVVSGLWAGAGDNDPEYADFGLALETLAQSLGTLAWRYEQRAVVSGLWPGAGDDGPEDTDFGLALETLAQSLGTLAWRWRLWPRVSGLWPGAANNAPLSPDFELALETLAQRIGRCASISSKTAASLDPGPPSSQLSRNPATRGRTPRHPLSVSGLAPAAACPSSICSYATPDSTVARHRQPGGRQTRSPARQSWGGVGQYDRRRPVRGEFVPPLTGLGKTLLALSQV